jgi:drug/metabolite transporter (DMT)-like permease
MLVPVAMHSTPSPLLNTDPTPPSRPRVLAAFAALYLIWGSTYLAIRFGLETLPPFLMAGTRFVVAGGLLYGFLRIRGIPAPSRRHWGSAAVVGLLLLLGGNGGVVWAQQRVDSGVAALLVATVPLWMVFFERLRPGGERPKGATLGGLALGTLGIVILVGPDSLPGVGGEGGRVDLVGALALMMSTILWALGSIWSRGRAMASPMMATAQQMLSGGVALLALGVVSGELSRLDLAGASSRSLLAVGYLIVFGSLIGYSSYIWLLGVSSPARVSTYAYVNPVVAVVLGWLFAGEPLTARTLLAAGIIVGGVVLVTLRITPSSRRSPRPSAPDPPGQKR